MGFDFTPLVVMAVMFMGAVVGAAVSGGAGIASIWLDVPAPWYWLPPLIGSAAGAVFFVVMNR